MKRTLMIIDEVLGRNGCLFVDIETPVDAEQRGVWFLGRPQIKAMPFESGSSFNPTTYAIRNEDKSTGSVGRE